MFSCERGGTRTTRGKRPPVMEIDRISIFSMFVFTSGFMNFEILTKFYYKEIKDYMNERRFKDADRKPRSR